MMISQRDYIEYPIFLKYFTSIFSDAQDFGNAALALQGSSVRPREATPVKGNKNCWRKGSLHYIDNFLKIL